jgi:hypothetical protein
MWLERVGVALPELTDLRTYTSKTYDNGDGTFTLEAHAGHIHYDNAGTLRNVDLQFEDKGTYWQVTKASYRLYVAKAFDAPDLIRFDNRFQSANHSIYYRPHSLWWVNMDDKAERTKWKDRQSVTGVLNAAANKITWADAFGSGVDFELTLRRSGFSKELVLPSKPPTGGAPYTNWALGVVSGFSADNLTVGAGGDWDGLTYYERTERMEVREAGGAKSYIQKAWGVDSSTPEKRRELPVFFEKKAGVLWQGKLIPESFIENAVYPARMDTITDYYAGAGDGHVGFYHASDGWATIQGAATGSYHADTAVDMTTESWKGAAAERNIARIFIPLDTSALDDGATISDAVLYTYLVATANGDNDGDDWITVVETSQPSTAALENVDYDLCGDSIDDPTEGIDNGDRLDLTGLSTGQYYTFALNATGIGWIDKTGTTKLGLREGHDVLDNEIAGAGATQNQFQVSTSEEAGTAKDPYLKVTYTVPGAQASKRLLRGVGA